MIIIKIVNASNNPNPSYATSGASGLDLRAYFEDGNSTIIEVGEIYMIPTGIFVEIPLNYEGQLRMRSGISTKFGIMLVNGVGTIDSDYRGEIKVPIINMGSKPYLLESGERVAQLVIAPYNKVEIETVYSLSDTDRGTGGFGSTGKK